MGKKEDILDLFKENKSKGNHVIVFVGDFGEKQLYNKVKSIEIAYIISRKNERDIHGVLEIAEKEDFVNSYLQQVKSVTEPFYFEKSFSENYFEEFSNIFCHN